MKTFATVNLGRQGVAKTPALLSSFGHCVPHVLFLQEIDINPSSTHRYVQDWKRRGFQCVLGSGPVPRVAIVAQEPIRKVTAPELLDSDRAVFACCEFLADGLVQKYVIGSVYGDASDEDLAAALVLQSLTFVQSFGLPWIIMGDFNLEQDCACFQAAFCQGGAMNLDSYFGPLRTLPPTRLNGQRRIDYGLAHPNVIPTTLKNYISVADHYAVCYEFENLAGIPQYKSPARLQPNNLDDKSIAEKFEQSWCSEPFLQALNRDDVDAAWEALSNAAEHVLCGQQENEAENCGAKLPRANTWVPRIAPATSKAALSDEPVRLRRLRRLGRRLRQLMLRPNDEQLQRTAFRAPDGLVTSFDVLSDWPERTLDGLCNVVHQTIRDCETSLRKERIDRWKEQIDASPTKALAWIKARAASEMAAGVSPPVQDPRVPLRAVHPSNIISEEEATWTELWNIGPQPMEPFERILADIGHEKREADVTIEWHGRNLKRRAKAMGHKAPGPDDWEPAMLARLPLRWFESFALLWAKVWERGAVPRLWQRARVALIPKQDGTWRPLCMATAAWRLGAAEIVQQLRSWVDSWASPHLLGGLPGRSVQHAHMRLHEALVADPDRLIVAEDLSKCFDTIDIGLACRALVHHGAPVRLVRLLKGFYSSQQRIFSVAGHLGTRWHSVSRGILQGCPVSPMIAASLLQLWTWKVVESPDSFIDAVVFVDDRTMWTEGSENQRDDAIRGALTRSKQFDETCGWTCRPTKCQFVCRNPETHADIIRETGYVHDEKLKVLGACHRLDGTCSPARVSSEELHLRLRFLRALRVPATMRAYLVGMLILAKMAWIACVATDFDVDMQSLRTDIAWALVGHVALRDAPKCLVFEIFGWQCDPEFAMEWAALTAAVQWHLRCPLWTDNVCLRFAAKPWQVLIPAAKAALDRWGWSVSHDGANITKQDHLGQERRFVLGVDGLDVLKAWLEYEHKRQALFATCRISRSLHRSEALDLAQGVLLPPPDGHCMLYGAVHKQIYFEAGASRAQRLVALASGCSVWHENQMTGLPRHQWHTTCMCGKEWPSRPHLIFQCEATAGIRTDAGVRAPTNRAQERLLAATVEFLPLPPRANADDNSTQVLVRAFASAMSQDASCVCCATDGSSKEDVAAWAAVVEGSQPIAAGFEYEDQSPFVAEVFGILHLLEAAAISMRSTRRTRVLLLCDCQAAIRVCKRSYSGCYQTLARRIWAALDALSHREIDVILHWVPAHDRIVPGWRPPENITEARARALNDAVDVAARDMALRRWQGSHRAMWHCDARAAKALETKLLKTAIAVAEQYHVWVN